MSQLICTTAMLKCIKIHQVSTAPVEKNHEPLKKRRRGIYSSDSSQEI